jgi:hypothetical protein
MKNLSFEDLVSLNENNILEFLYGMYPFNMEALQEKKLHTLTSFKISNSFTFKVYAPTDLSFSKVEKIKAHVYEINKKSFYNPAFEGSQLLNVKKDNIFNRTEWQDLFLDDWRSAGILSPAQLLGMMRYTARLCRLRVFE